MKYYAILFDEVRTYNTEALAYRYMCKYLLDRTKKHGKDYRCKIGRNIYGVVRQEDFEAFHFNYSRKNYKLALKIWNTGYTTFVYLAEPKKSSIKQLIKDLRQTISD